MSRNKPVWIFALILAALLSLPIAHAQAAGGNRWLFIAINAAVIGIVLFIIQSILIPNKPDKEKISMWIIVLAASLVIAFLYGQDGLIWKTGPLARFFSIYILVNSIIIGAVIYFVLGLSKLVNLQSPEGQKGYVILIFLVAVIFAVKVGNQWIWAQPVVQGLYQFLFVVDSNGLGGILNPSAPLYKLWVFLGSGFLLSFFFNNFLVTDTKSPWVNYALAFLIALSMANAGVTIKSVIILAEMVFFVVLAKQIKIGENKGINWLVSFLLIGWASAAATYGTAYQGLIAGIVGWPLSLIGLIPGVTVPTQAQPTSWWWWAIVGIAALVFIGLPLGGAAIVGSKWGILAGLGVLALIIFLVPGIGFGAFILFGLILLIMFGMFRGENRQRILTLAWGGIKRRLNAIFGFQKFLRDTAKDKEPQFIIENRLLFQALANYTTRSEITYRYWDTVLHAIEIWPHLKIGKFPDQKLLRKDIIAYRSGGITMEGEKADGWNQLNLEAVELLNRLTVLMFNSFVGSEFNLKAGSGADVWQPEVQEFTALEEQIENLKRRIETAKSQYDLRVNSFRDHHVLNAYKGVILNMSNVTGDVEENPQKFARPGAIFIGNDNKLQNDKNTYYGNGFEAKGVQEGEVTLPVHEVNQFGEYVEDLVKQRRVNKFGSLPSDPRELKKPRKLEDPNDIIDYPKFSDLMDNIGKDWKGLAEDIRYGLHHTMSRTEIDYTNALQKGMDYKWADDEVPFTSPPSLQRYALDMRALADPGKNSYWGRVRFDAKTEDPIKGIPPDNPFPILSSLGLRDYLSGDMDLDIKDKTLAKKYKGYYPADTAVDKKDLTAEKRKYIGMHLSDTPVQSKSGGGGTH